MREELAPLSSHTIALDRVSGLANLLIPLVFDFIQKLDQLSFSGNGFLHLRVSWLDRELKNVPKVP